jgi:dienelactone hydrolase
MVPLLFLALSATLPAKAALLPPPEGPSAVGYWRTTLTTGSPERTLLLECWYPAASAGGAAKRYATPAVEAALEKQFSLAPGWMAPVTVHAREGAAAQREASPVVLFSHGLSWPVTLYQSLTEDLASRGYVVIAVNHPGGAAIDLGEGRMLPPEALPTFPDAAAEDAFLARWTAAWTDDLRAVLDQLPRFKASASSPLSARLDLGRIALLGHSLGASAAARLTEDPRVKAVAALEGRLREAGRTSLDVHVPFLHLIGEYNRLELEGRSYLPTAGAPVYQAVIAGTGHAYFSDLIAIYKSGAPPDWRARHRYELEPDRILQITRDYVAAFLGRYLSGADHPLLHPTSYAARVDGPRAAGYAEVRLTIDTR